MEEIRDLAVGTGRRDGPERAVMDLSLVVWTNGPLPASTAARRNELSKIN